MGFTPKSNGSKRRKLKKKGYNTDGVKQEHAMHYPWCFILVKRDAN